jgi:peptide deformylase
MARLNILHYPDARLHKIAVPVVDTEFNEELLQLIRDMAQTMYEAPGIGLAATQVDVHKRVIVIDISETRDQLQVFINPEIMSSEGQCLWEEGCLSVPGIYEEVERAESITVKAQDQHGNAFQLAAQGLLAICIQHEVDHLNGKVFVEKLSRLKLNRIITKLKKSQLKNR